MKKWKEEGRKWTDLCARWTVFLLLLFCNQNQLRRVTAKEVSLWVGVLATALTYMLRKPTTVWLTHNQSFGIWGWPCFGFDFYRKRCMIYVVFQYSSTNTSTDSWLTNGPRVEHHLDQCVKWYMKCHIQYHFTFVPHRLIRTHKLPGHNVSGFIAQLVRASHRYREVTGSNLVEVLNFSGFYTQLHELHS